MDDLDRRSGRSFERRAQASMPVDEALEGTSESPNVELGSDANRYRDIVGGAFRSQLTQKPDGLLASRKRVLIE
jgi:hypothetical protein